MRKAHLRAQRQQLPPQVLQHDIQLVRADVGLGVDQNVGVRAVFDETLQDPAVARVAPAGVELAVRERARAALAELDVGPRVERTRFPKRLHVALALLDAFAALQQNRPCAALRQHQRTEQSRRPRADDDRTHLRRGDRLRQRVDDGRVARNVLIFAAFERRRLVFERHGKRPDKAHAVAGVDAAAQDAEIGQFTRVHA